MIPLSVWFTKATFTCFATAAVGVGSSASMAASTAVHYPLTLLGRCEAIANRTTDPEQ